MSNTLFPEPGLPGLIEEAGDILARAKEKFSPVATFCLFSGGNDSTALFEIVADKVDAAVHISTGIGIMEKGRTALDQHIAILGKTGSGKTWTAKLIVEHVAKQNRQVCIIDPTAAWWGLRLAFGGRGPGLDIVLLGGELAASGTLFE